MQFVIRDRSEFMAWDGFFFVTKIRTKNLGAISIWDQNLGWGY